jgi:hypothetical protein
VNASDFMLDWHFVCSPLCSSCMRNNARNHRC